MEEDKDIRPLMSCKLRYSLGESGTSHESSGSAEARLDTGQLSILPSFDEPLFILLRDITNISAADYKIDLELPEGRLTLSDLGYHYEDFLRSLIHARNEMLLKDMLMQEAVRDAGAKADYAISDEGGGQELSGKCESRLYETGLVLLPEYGDPIRIRYADIIKITKEDYSLIIEYEGAGRIILSAMGGRFDAFSRQLSEAMNELVLKAQTLLQEMLPDISTQYVRKLSRVMSDGRAARKSEVDAVSPNIWSALEKRITFSAIGREYEFLKTMSDKERTCIGIKRGLLGDLTGQYLWCLMPVYGGGSSAPGNAIAMESISGEEGGKATYFFRITGRKEYSLNRDIEELHRATDTLIESISRSMIEINFRREPIYLPEARLAMPEYSHYLFSIRRLPSLRLLRELFIGRVIHSSDEQWKRDVGELLTFNITSVDDAAKWRQGEAG